MVSTPSITWLQPKTTSIDFKSNAHLERICHRINSRFSRQDTLLKKFSQTKHHKWHKINNLLSKKKQTVVLHVQSSRNNTLLTCSSEKDEKRKTICMSGGTLGFKNSRKSSIYASQAAAKLMLSRIKQMGYKYVHIRLSGFGRAKSAVVRALHHSTIKILQINECTPIVHNGCRRPRKRRI